ncbi:MAG: HAMP domain-containing histidine kinase, partial [Bacteroidales bacterium]|nr:HAMP domain-containing histidine kinase [Bacteroidales bacterium]
FINFFLRLFGEPNKGISLLNSTDKGFSRSLTQRNNALYYLKEYSNSIDKKTVDVFKILKQKEKDANVIRNQNVELKSMLDKYQEISKEAKRQNDQINLKNKTLIRQEEKLKLANATKDKFFSIIAHDLKNPLSVITTLTDFLENHYDISGEAKKRKYISLINKSSKLLYRLLENLLEWSRSQTGKLKLEPQVFNIDELIHEEIIHTKTFAAQKLIALQAGKVEPVKVNADLQMMSAVLRNLVSNAIKFSQERTTVTISVVKEDDKRVKIMVKDEGIGIHPEEQYKLFILDESYTRHGTKGETSTGLGLLLCKDFVEKNGGKIGLESEVGKGSMFWFTIPVYSNN